MVNIPFIWSKEMRSYSYMHFCKILLMFLSYNCLYTTHKLLCYKSSTKEKLFDPYLSVNTTVIHATTLGKDIFSSSKWVAHCKKHSVWQHIQTLQKLQMTLNKTISSISVSMKVASFWPDTPHRRCFGWTIISRSGLILMGLNFNFPMQI